MPHGLGNPRDFDPGFVPEPEIAPQNQGNIRRLEDEIAELENLGQELERPFEGVDVPDDLMNLGDENAANAEAELLQYLSMLQPPYTVTPHDLTMLKNEGIISLDEARAYLVGKGVIEG